MTSRSVYHTAQCSNERCRFRFPATAIELEGLDCPRCGAALIVVPRPPATHSPLPTVSSDETPPTSYRLGAILDNIRSIHNTGSIFRTADGAGFDHLYLCGMTATPDQPRLAKAALGAERSVPWSGHPNALDLVIDLAQDGCFIIALERIVDAPSQPSIFDSLRMPQNRPVALIIGNEKAGIDPALLPYCGQILRLPMVGQKSSLNVAVAFGIAAYQMRFGQATGV